ncbi:hypothetical protein [Clostridium akagii]|uniref:hypothetical protein n=1 Tax=Clostridium akagii TaxID=91623 RepID=UPI00047A1DF0|nr:hypothetical protein [Clostridium akagii]
MSRGDGKLHLDEKVELSGYKTGDYSLINITTVDKISIVTQPKFIKKIITTTRKRNIIIIALIIVLPLLFISLNTIINNINIFHINASENKPFNPNFSPFIKKQIAISDKRNDEIGVILGNSYDMAKSKSPTSNNAYINYIYTKFVSDPNTRSSAGVTTGVYFDTSEQKSLTQSLLLNIIVTKNGLLDESTFKKLIQTYSDTLNPDEYVNNIKSAFISYKKGDKSSNSFDKGHIHISVFFANANDKNNDLLMTLSISQENEDNS